MQIRSFEKFEDLPELLTPKEVAQFLRSKNGSVGRVYKAIRLGQLRANRACGYRILKQDLKAYLDATTKVFFPLKKEDFEARRKKNFLTKQAVDAIFERGMVA